MFHDFYFSSVLQVGRIETLALIFCFFFLPQEVGVSLAIQDFQIMQTSNPFSKGKESTFNSPLRPPPSLKHGLTKQPIKSQPCAGIHGCMKTPFQVSVDFNNAFDLLHTQGTCAGSYYSCSASKTPPLPGTHWPQL